jgi:AcrR family transcriptional regulator
MPHDAPADLLTVALELIAERGWGAFGLAALSRRAGRPLHDVYAELPGRTAVLDRLGTRADEAMLGLSADELAEMTPRERLFEAIMRRLDALAPYRPGLIAMARERGCDTAPLCGGIANLRRMSGRLVELAGQDRGGLRHALARNALALLYARVFAVWLNDDTPDQARTLAELDQRLGQLGSVLGWPGGAAPRPAAAAA